MRQPHRPFAAAVLALVGLPAFAVAQSAAPPDEEAGAANQPLFEAHEPIALTIRADFAALKDDREQEEEERDGRILVTDPAGNTLDLSLEVRTRGRFRLQRSTCEWPPLRLDFTKGELDGTFLDGQDKLKLVSHCREHERYEQNVLKEYLVYRMFNALTDRSFRVRLARVTYEDTSGKNDPLTRWGFLIEDDELLAERLGGELLEDVETIHPARITGANAGLITIFQYMVGNTDFSLFRSHNAKIVNTGSELLPVPYDFDWTGFVDAPYARPDPKLGIRSVKQRVFRGLCRADVDYQGFYARFRQARPAIEALIRDQDGLTDDTREDALEYIGDFYEVIDDEGRARRSIEGACRGG